MTYKLRSEAQTLPKALPALDPDTNWAAGPERATINSLRLPDCA